MTLQEAQDNLYQILLNHNQYALKDILVTYIRYFSSGVDIIDELFQPVAIRLINDESCLAVLQFLIDCKNDPKENDSRAEITAFRDFFPNALVCEAVYCQKSEIINFLCTHFNVSADSIAQGLARRGDREKLNAVLTEEGIYIHEIAKGVSEGGHFELVEEIISKEPSMITTAATAAARYGHYTKALSLSSRKGGENFFPFMRLLALFKIVSRSPVPQLRIIEEIKLRMLINNLNTQDMREIDLRVTFVASMRMHFLNGYAEEIPISISALNRAKKVASLMNHHADLSVDVAVEIVNKENAGALLLLVAAVAFPMQSKFTQKTGIPTEILLMILENTFGYKTRSLLNDKAAGVGLFVARLLPKRDNAVHLFSANSGGKPLMIVK